MAEAGSAVSAADAHARILSNVDDYDAGRIDHKTFHARQCEIWDQIRAADLDADVCKMIRDATQGGAPVIR